MTPRLSLERCGTHRAIALRDASARSISPTDRNRTRAGVACLLLSVTQMLGGCTERVSERCSGSHNEMACTATFKKSDGKWSTTLDGGHDHTAIVISGTFSIEGGSGTLTLWGSDKSMEYQLSAEEPVVVEDLSLGLISSSKGETHAVLETVSEEPLEGFSAEYSFVTR